MLEDKVHRLAVSMDRLVRAVGIPTEMRNGAWWRFFRREAWLHFRRSARLLWLALSPDLGRQAGKGKGVK